MKPYYLPLLVITMTLSLTSFSGCKPAAEPDEEKADAPVLDVVTLSPQAVQKSGLATVIVSSRAVTQDIVTTGEIAVNQNAVFQVGALTTGRITADNVTLGDFVKQGQTLATLYNLDVARINADYIHEAHQNEIDVAKAKTEMSLAQKTFQREKALYQEGISPRKEMEQAQSQAALAKTELSGQLEHGLHIRSEAKSLLGAYGTAPGSLHSETIRATSALNSPRSGMITKKMITIGAIVSPGQVLYEVTDLGRVWLNIAIYPKDVSVVRVGQKVQFKTGSLPNQVFTGQIHYLPPNANETSQTFTARAFLNNPGVLLKPGMLGQTRIGLNKSVSKPFIPAEALQSYGKEFFVFIPQGGNRYKKQIVQPGTKVEDGYFINTGLKPEDVVIGKGSFSLKAAMLKSQFSSDED